MNWKDVYNAALTTVGKKSNKETSDSWKKKMLLAEHSPIRLLTFSHTFESIKYWVVMHLVRHKVGVEHFVKTQRDDRTDTGKFGRDDAAQGALVQYRIDGNAQSLITISRKRLCNDAHRETTLAWTEVLSSVDDPIVRSVCVPECIYRGFCTSVKPCGYANSDSFVKRLGAYREV